MGRRGEERWGRGDRQQSGPYLAVTTMGYWSLISLGNSRTHYRNEASEPVSPGGKRRRLYSCAHPLLINGCLGEGHEFSLPACPVQGRRGKILRGGKERGTKINSSN